MTTGSGPAHDHASPRVRRALGRILFAVVLAFSSLAYGQGEALAAVGSGTVLPGATTTVDYSATGIVGTGSGTFTVAMTSNASTCAGAIGPASPTHCVTLTCTSSGWNTGGGHTPRVAIKVGAETYPTYSTGTCGAVFRVTTAISKVVLYDSYQNASDPFVVASVQLYVAPPPDPPPVTTGGSCRLSDDLLVAGLREAGWVDDAAGRTALAVLLAESGGNVAAVHHNTNDSYDLGLFQVNDDAHPSYDRDQLGRDPAYNLAAGWTISASGTDWSPWVAYTTGAHKKFLTRADLAWRNGPTAGVAYNSCAEAGLSSADGEVYDPQTDPPDADSSPGCSGWNPVNYLRCLFIPSDGALQGFGAVRDEAVTKPPVSIIVGGLSWVTTIYDGWTTDPGSCTGSMPTVGNQNPCVATELMTYGETGVPALEVAGELMEDGWGRMLYGACEIAVWAGAIFLIWRKLALSFGGKGSVTE